MKTETTLAQPQIESKPLSRPRQSFFQKYEGVILGGTSVLIVLGIWQAVWSYTDWISPLFFSGPSAIGKQFWISLTQGNLLADLAFSGKNFTIGFGIALVSGLLIYEHLTVHRWGTSRIALAFFTLNGIISCILGGLGIVDVLGV